MSLVSELQTQALDEKSSIVELLRKAMTVAAKLRLDDFSAWCERELNGFARGEKIPQYREVVGTVCAWNDFHRRYDQVQFESAKEEQLLSRMDLNMAISEIDAYAKKASGKLHVNFSPELQEQLAKAMSSRAPISLRFETAVCARIVDSVRTAILKWALQLERDGIVGDGMSFTKEEKAAASKDAPGLSIGTYINQNTSFGTVVESPIQLGSGSSQTTNYEKIDLEAVSRLIDDLSRALESGASSKAAADLKAELQTLRSVLAAPKLKHSWVADGLKSVRKILEGAAGELVADGIKAGQYIEGIAHALGIR